MQRLLTITDLAKAYGFKSVFRGLSLDLPAGNFALVGANGVGKSTLLRLIAGAEHADSGRIVVDGVDLAQTPIAAKERLAYVPDEPVAYPFLTGREFLNLVAELRRLDDAELAAPFVEAMALDKHLDTRFQSMSLGTQRKFFVVAAFMDEPRVLLMDELTNGLDRAAREVLIELLRDSAPWRLTLFSTHDEDFIVRCDAQRVEMSRNELKLEPQTQRRLAEAMP
ncbi:MAG: ABC transporter ATP-binding protein [Thiohalocapsa sp. PB-PSB1]|nr:MAG: hypothetical protein N838_27545 [Thiohalocapsa sp. PB-PSB1]QQO54918.1 MAG: ABC transporter ATP-binding protein [Thiohalocapsa sp. PB-PSB1]